MWKAVLIHRQAGALPLGTFSSWERALGACVRHVGLITPGRYRLEEVEVDRVGGQGLAFAVLHHPRGGWIANAIGPGEPPTLEEVEATLGAWGLERGRWVWLEAEWEGGEKPYRSGL